MDREFGELDWDNIEEELSYVDPELLDQFQIIIYSSSHKNITSKVAQSFIPTVQTINKIDLRLRKVGSPEGFIISIKEDLYNIDLTSIYISSSNISDKKSIGKTNIICLY